MISLKVRDHTFLETTQGEGEAKERGDLEGPQPESVVEK